MPEAATYQSRWEAAMPVGGGLAGDSLGDKRLIGALLARIIAARATSGSGQMRAAEILESGHGAAW